MQVSDMFGWVLFLSVIVLMAYIIWKRGGLF